MAKKTMIQPALIRGVEWSGRVFYESLAAEPMPHVEAIGAAALPMREDFPMVAPSEAEVKRRAAKIQAEGEYNAQIEMFEQKGITREQYVASRVITLACNGEIGHATEISNRAKVQAANATYK